MASEADIPAKVSPSDSEEDIHIYSESFGADSDVATSEPFLALKNAYEHTKQNYLSANEKCQVLKLECQALKLEIMKLHKENERLKQTSETGESSSYDLSSEEANKTKIYLLQTKIEELTNEKKQLQLLLQTYKLSDDTSENQPLTEIQCQNENCQKKIESLEKINKDLLLDTKCQESVIQRLKKKIGNSNTEEETNVDVDMETDGINAPTDLVEYDFEPFLSEYKHLKSEVRRLLSEVQTYRELHESGLLCFRKRKTEESDFEMEDYEKRQKVTGSDVSRFRQSSPSIKRPPKEELETSNPGTLSPALNYSDEDLYGASTSLRHISQSLDKTLLTSELSKPTVKHISSSYGPVYTDISGMQPSKTFQPGSAPALPTSGRKAPPSALFLVQNVQRSGSQVSNQGSSDLKFTMPIMQETGGDLLPPRNPPNITEHDHRPVSPDLFTPATYKHVEEHEEETEDDAVELDFTHCPMCSRRFDRSLFSAEYINHHVNSHFDGSSEYEFVDILQ